MRAKIESFDARFRALHDRSRAAVEALPSDLLFRRPSPSVAGTFGEYLLRSAGAVEQMIGGITARLWDDPFEWTLPEELSSTVKVLDYIAEVESTRQRGFAFLASDEELAKRIPAPEEIRSIFEILLDTLARAEHFQGRAFAIFQLVRPVEVPHR